MLTRTVAKVQLVSVLWLTVLLGITAAQGKKAAQASPSGLADKTDQMLDQYGVAQSTRADIKKLSQDLAENQKKTQSTTESQDIWQPKVFGKACLKESCTNPCGLTGACPPSVGNGNGGGQNPQPTPPSTPCAANAPKEGCAPGFGGGGGQPPKPISPCSATSSCGPGVGSYGGTYDEKALQFRLHSNPAQLPKPQTENKPTANR